MAYEFYVTVEGAKQGKFKAESPREEHKDKIPGIAFHYNVELPRDSASGRASGKRIHHPVAFVKEWGASTPQFFQALCTNESLKSVFFEFTKTDPDGEEYVYHAIKLVGASVTAIDQNIASDADANQGQSHDLRELEKISLTFQRIEIENHDGKTMAADEWFPAR